MVARGAALALVIAGATWLAGPARAQSMADYTAMPTSVANVPPNVLIVLDDSYSMKRLAYEEWDKFIPTETYAGLFDHAECYKYDATGDVFQPDPDPNPASQPAGGWTCQGNATHEWSGNLLNFMVMRRMDIAKQALTGGPCTNSTPDGCLQVTGLKDSGMTTNKATAADAQYRMPESIRPSSGNVYFHNKAFDTNPMGSFCVDDDSTRPSSGGSDCDDGDGYVETGYGIKIDLLAPVQGLLQDLGERVRFGIMLLGLDGRDGGELVAPIGSTTADVVAAINGAQPNRATPVGEALFEGLRYLAQVAPYQPTKTNYPYGTNADDPYYFANMSAHAPCCQSFAITFTDGFLSDDDIVHPNVDDMAPTTYGGMDDEIIDDVAYWGHITDLRQPTIPDIGESGNDLPGEQTVTTYAFFAFGNPSDGGPASSIAAARFGGFVDSNGNNLPDLASEYDTVDNFTGELGADGLPDTYFEAKTAFEVKDKLAATFASILQRSTSGSAASVLSASSTGEGAVYQSYFFPSIVDGLREIKWPGYVHSLFLDRFGNLREDSGAGGNPDGKLVYADDHIIRTRFDSGLNEVVADRYADADENGVADSGTPVSTVPIRNVNAIWEAGTRLALTSSANRNIITWVDTDHDGVVDGGEQIDFAASNATALAPYLRPGVSPYTVDNIINFIRGDQIAGMRDRELTVAGSPEVWKLGDSIHARPTVVGAPAQRYDVIYGDTSYTAFFTQYKDRRQVAYVGANDGMLHAFNAGYFHRGDDPGTGGVTEHGYFTKTPTDNSGGKELGEELFGFIPQELLPHLRWLTQPEYAHVYYVDLSPKVTDARIFTPDADHPNGWGTILLGGFRMGGSCGGCTTGNGAPPMTVTADFNDDGDTTDADDTRTFYSAYFVLDITNPESADYPKLLWSFTSADLGLTTTVPSMLRINPSGSSITDNADAKWYMLVGSGPTGYDGSIAQSGKLFAIDLAAGPGAGNANVTTLPAESLDAFMGNPVPIDRDFDYRVDVAYMGSTIHDGTLPWRGKLYRLTMNDCATAPCATDDWGIAAGTDRQPTELLDDFPDTGPMELGPVSTAPAVAIDDSNKLWVFAGTGRLYDAVDQTNTDQQYFVGVKDSVMNAGCSESTRTNCHDDELVNVSSAQVCLIGVGTCGGTTDQVTGVGGATDFPSLIALVASKDGWYTTLPATRERALARPLALAGLIMFPTFTPASDPCNASGASQLYALYYMTGSAYSSPVIGTTASGSNKNVNRSTSLGSGRAYEAVAHVGMGGGEGSAHVVLQNSDNVLDLQEARLDASLASRFMSWYDARL